MAKISTDFTTGPVLKKLVVFALPFLASNLVQSLYSVADMLIVGNFTGAAAMSGVNIGGQITFLFTNGIIGLSMGGTVLIGQYLGSKETNRLERVMATTITLLIVLAVFITVVMLFLREPVLHVMQTPGEAFPEANSYLTVTLTGIIFIFGYNAFSAILRGMGNSKQPFYFVSAACITNIALDMLFVAVFKMGAFGAAIATVISQGMSMFLCIIYLLRNNFQFDFKLKSFKIYGPELKLILKIGFPTCIQNSITSLSFTFIQSVTNIVGGVAGSAAVGAVGKINSFAFMPVNAISASISSVAAQNFGARKVDRAVKSLVYGIISSVIITYTFFALVRIFPAEFVRIFGDDPEVIAQGVSYITTQAYDFLVIPFVFCLNGFLIGGGHTLFTLINSLLSSVIFRAPLCYIFGVTLGWGVRGVGVAAPAASLATLLIIAGFMLTGRWKQNAVMR
ncbi:MAG: MATE family efflux transporter [Spirochaetaceae bacterium]|jgi:putative MATE family efflux protein|nr:MATE family efflux transporter [Spirochaetaceae bacterium]